MMNLLAVPKFIQTLLDNKLLTIILAVILVLIVVLIIAIIVVKVKDNKKKKNAAAEAPATDETGEPAPQPAETQQVPAAEQEETNEQPAVEPVKAESASEAAPAPVEEKKEEPANEAVAPAEEPAEEKPEEKAPEKKPAPAKTAKTTKTTKQPAKIVLTEKAANSKPKTAAKTTAKADAAEKKTEPAKTTKTTAPKTTKAAVKPEPKKETVSFKDGKWLITKTDSGKFMFALYANNGEKMLPSREYSSLASAKTGIETYKKNINGGGTFKIVQTKTGDFIFHLLDARGGLIAISADYKTRSSCDSAIESTKRFAMTAPVDVEK